MTELCSTATSRILMPMKLRHSLVREELHWPSRRSPASGGLRARFSLGASSQSPFPKVDLLFFAQLSQDSEILQGCSIPRHLGSAGNLLKKPPHDFSTARLR